MLGLKSKLLIGSLAAITTVATAVGIGVGISQQTRIDNTNKQSNDSTNQLNEMSNEVDHNQFKDDTSLSNENDVTENKKVADPVLVKTLNLFNKNDILFINEQEPTKPLVKSETYPFSISNKNLQLKMEDKKIPEGIRLSVRISLIANTVDTYNNGKLTISLIALKEKEKTSHHVDLTFDDFKKADSSLIALFEQGTNTLDLTNTNVQSSTLYVTVEDLNNKIKQIATKDKNPKPIRALGVRNELKPESKEDITGLNYIFKNHSKFSSEEKKDLIKNVSISGGVKLNDIKPRSDNSAIDFYLGNDGFSFLKLVKTDDTASPKTTEALIECVKLSNLLTSDIVLFPTEFNREETSKYLNELSKSKDQTEGFFVNKEQQNQLNHGLYLNLKNPISTENKDEISIFVKPFVIDKQQSPNTVNLRYELAFGEDGFATLIGVQTEDDLTSLKNNGFNLVAYYKQIKQEALPIKATDITSKSLKLNTYLNEANFTKPISISSLNNGFKKLEVKSEKLEKHINLKLDEMNESSHPNATYLVFVGYSYKNIKEQSILFNPSVLLLNFKNKTK